MPYILYIHEPVDDLPDLARHGFPPETFFSTDLEWVVEDAIFESSQDGKPHVVLQAEVPEEILIVPEEDIEDALFEDEDEENDWEAVVEEGRFEAGEETEFEDPEESVEEEIEEETQEEEEEDWPQTLAEAIELTQSATLSETLAPQNAVVLGEPVELTEGQLTEEEARAERWFRFPMEPSPLVQFKLPFWRRLVRGLVTGR